jgi:hypothetical protein
MGILKFSFWIESIGWIQRISPFARIIDTLYGNNMKYRLDELQATCYAVTTTATWSEHFVAVETSNLKEKKKEAYRV